MAEGCGDRPKEIVKPPEEKKSCGVVVVPPYFAAEARRTIGRASDNIERRRDGFNQESHREARRRREKGNQQALNTAEVPLELTDRNGTGTERVPYHFRRGKFLCNSGCIGFRSGDPKENFDPELARRQLQNLKGEGIQTFICFVEHSQVQAIGRQIGIQVLPRYISSTSYDLTSNNEKLFRELAEYIGPNTLIFCRHGCHRAIVASIGAILASGKVRNFDEAFKAAGGLLSNFPHQYAAPMLSQVIQFAQENGIPVEPQYTTFIDEMRRKKDQRAA